MSRPEVEYGFRARKTLGLTVVSPSVAARRHLLDALTVVATLDTDPEFAARARKRFLDITSEIEKRHTAPGNRNVAAPAQTIVMKHTGINTGN